MIYILFLIGILNNGEYGSAKMGYYAELDVCFEAREQLVERIGRPILNYQVICIRSNVIEEE